MAAVNSKVKTTCDFHNKQGRMLWLRFDRFPSARFPALVAGAQEPLQLPPGPKVLISGTAGNSRSTTSVRLGACKEKNHANQPSTNYTPSKSNRMVVYLFKMAIFYSYLKLPEGKSNRNTIYDDLCFHTVNVGAFFSSEISQDLSFGSQFAGHITCLAATQYWVELWKIPWMDQLSQLIVLI